MVTAEAPPKRPEDVPPLRQKISDRLAGLQQFKVGEDATAGAQALGKAAAALRETLESASKQLDAYESAHRASVELVAADRIAARSAQLEEYRNRTKELKSLRPRIWSDLRQAAEREKANSEYAHINALTDTTVRQQTARERTLNQYAALEQEATQRLAEARQALSAALNRSPTAPASAGSPEAALDGDTLRRYRELETRNLAWQAFLAGLRVEQLAIDKVVLNLESAAADAIIPVLQDYARTLGDFRSRLEQVTSSEHLANIRRELESAKTRQRQAYWRVRLVIAEGRRAFSSRLDGIRQRFRASEQEDLLQEMGRVRGVYDRLHERIDRTTGEEKTNAYNELTRFREVFDKRREEIAQSLDSARRELEDLIELRDQVYDDLKIAIEALRAALPEIDTAEEREEFDRLMTEIAADYRTGLESTVSEVISAENGVIDRLDETLAELDTFNKYLVEVQGKLFWSYRLARGPGFIQTWRTAIAGFDVQELGRNWAMARADARDRIDLRGPTRAIIWSIGLLVLVILGIRYSHRLWRLAERHEERVSEGISEGDGGDVHLSDRVRIQLCRILGMILPVGLPILLLLVFFWQDTLIPPDLRRIFIHLCLVILLAVVARALIKRLFRTGKPRFRIIPCSNVVANYYRFWLSVLWWITMPVTPLIMVMYAFQLAPGLAEAIRKTMLAGVLLVLIIFGRNRQMIVRVLGRAWAARRPIVFGFLVQTYPFVLMLITVLLVLEVVGYDAFVNYVIRNLLHTFGAIVIASFLSSLLHDFVRRHTAQPAEAAKSESTDGGQAGDHGIDELLQQFETREFGLLVSSAATLGQWGTWLGALAWIAMAWGLTEDTARSVFAFELLSPPPDSGAQPITVGRVLVGLVLVLISFKISKFIRGALTEKVYPAYQHVSKGAQATISTLLHYTLITVGFYVGLRVMHIELGALAVLLGGLGLGLGLGLQPLLVNFVSGLILFAERHVKVGDLVMVGEDLGEVTSISMRSTRVRSVDGIDLIIPNTEFVTSKVVNWTLQDTKIRGKLNVGVAYGSDVAKVRTILLEIANKESRVLLDPEPVVWFTDFGESSLNFTLAAWYPAAGDRWSAMIDMRYEIDRRFREEGIEIPFPQRTLSIKSDCEIPIRVLPRGRRDVSKPSDTVSEG